MTLSALLLDLLGVVVAIAGVVTAYVVVWQRFMRGRLW